MAVKYAMVAAPRTRARWSLRRRKRAADIATYVILALGAAASAFPLLWMAATAFKPTEEIFSPNLFPTKLTFQHFIALFQDSDFKTYFLNSFVVSMFTVTVGLLLDSLGGFALAKGKFPGRNVIFWLVLATMMVPFFVVIVPTYVIMSNLQLTNTLTGLVLPFVASGFGIFIMTQNIKEVPDSLLEAARVDGCGLLRTYWSVVLPVVRPAMGALAVFRFVSSWNSYLFPLIMIREASKMTIPLGIARLKGIAGTVVWGTTMAASLLSVLPILIVFLIMQRQFISGLTLGSLKE